MHPNPDFDNIDKATLELVPEKLAREYCFLPKSIDGNVLTLYCPNDQDYEIKNGPILEFALNKKLKWIPVPRRDIEDAIAKHYVSSEPTIRNCNIKFRFSCPKTWSSLSPTGIDSQRKCGDCGKIVYLCLTEQDAINRGREDKCVAYADPECGM
ncbi:hypothetical protein N9Y42_11080, partial [Mariniblastus sp.]|nr:hypothetical protein [Mariniblastus sp.]